MSLAVTRRQFCRSLAAAAASSVAGAARAIEPVSRQGTARFKFSLAAYSYRDLLSANPPVVTLEQFVLDCAAMGLEGTELTSYYFPPDPTPEFLRRLKKLCFVQGLDVSGTAVGNDFCHLPGQERDKEIAHVKRWVDFAEILGAPVIRIFSGDAKSDAAEAHRLAVLAIEECCAYAGERGVYLALENHGGLTTTADGILALVHDVSSPWFGVNLDTGNFSTDDVYGDLARLAPFAVNVQVKVSIRPGGGPKQPTDFARLASILRDAGYQGYIVLEFEEEGDPRTECPKYVDLLREAFRV
jgi:sugar phosphate isomerase/epimerase